MNTDTVELIYCEVENTYLCVPLSSLALPWKSPHCTAKPCPVLPTGREAADGVSSSEAEGSAASQHKNLCPAACLGHSSPSASCVQYSRSLHGSAAQPEMCYGTFILKITVNWDGSL